MTIPTPDPAQGAAAEAQAAEARRTALEAVTAGSLTLEELFAQVDAEDPHHQLGHIHARAALLALAHIGDVKADQILDGLGIKHDEHLDVLGSEQRAAILQEVADHS